MGSKVALSTSLTSVEAVSAERAVRPTFHTSFCNLGESQASAAL